MRSSATRSLVVIALLTAGCSWLSSDHLDRPDPRNREVAAEIHPGLLNDGEPALSADAAVAISRDYLARMRPTIAAPELHVVADITAASAVRGADAWMLDPCIPRVDDPTTVWVTRGVGDYLNLVDFAWSRHFGQFDAGFDLACRGAAASGTIVIDDTTGYILGVYPGEHQGLQPPESAGL